jgi:thiol-disulfide isomerase/thioredoxin
VRIVESVTAGLIVCVAVLAATAGYGLIWRRRRGALRDAVAAKRTDALTPQQLGHPLGPRATLVQFSSAFCAPCRATRRVLAEVAGMVDGVTHVEIDAESRLELVRSLRVLATPTVFVLDHEGTVIRRGTGLPRKADVIAALGAVAADDA